MVGDGSHIGWGSAYPPFSKGPCSTVLISSTFFLKSCWSSSLPCVTPQFAGLDIAAEHGRPEDGQRHSQCVRFARARTQGLVCIARPPAQGRCFSQPLGFFPVS